MRRYALRDDQWDRIKDFLPGREAIGRSRGGLTTKIHVLIDALGNPVDVMLTPGQAHDLTCAEPLLEGVDPEALIGDKAYDADPLRDTLAQREIAPVIPSKANRKMPSPCEFALYCERNLVERFFNKLKHFVPSPRATTSSREIFSPASPRLRYHSSQLKTGPNYRRRLFKYRFKHLHNRRRT